MVILQHQMISTSLPFTCGIFLLAISVLTAEAVEIPPLRSFPESERLWMGITEGHIEPAEREVFTSKTSAYYDFHKEHKAFLKSEEHWLTIDSERLANEREALRIEKAQIHNAEENEEDKNEEDSLRLEGARDELLQQRLKLREAMVAEDIPQKYRKRIQEAVNKVDSQIQRIDKLLLPERRDKNRQLERDKNSLALKRKQLAFDALERDSVKKSSFNGVLELNSTLIQQLEKNQMSSIWLEPGQNIGQIVDRSHYRIAISGESTLLESIPKKNLLAMLSNNEQGVLIPARYERTDQKPHGAKFIPIHIFHVEKKYNDQLKNVTQRKELVHLYQTLDEPCRLVQKRQIAFLRPDVLEASGWAGLAKELWPGCKVIAVGPQTLAILPPSEN